MIELLKVTTTLLSYSKYVWWGWYYIFQNGWPNHSGLAPWDPRSCFGFMPVTFLKVISFGLVVGPCTMVLHALLSASWQISLRTYPYKSTSWSSFRFLEKEHFLSTFWSFCRSRYFWTPSVFRSRRRWRFSSVLQPALKPGDCFVGVFELTIDLLLIFLIKLEISDRVVELWKLNHRKKKNLIVFWSRCGEEDSCC